MKKFNFRILAVVALVAAFCVWDGIGTCRRGGNIILEYFYAKNKSI